MLIESKFLAELAALLDKHNVTIFFNNGPADLYCDGEHVAMITQTPSEEGGAGDTMVLIRDDDDPADDITVCDECAAEIPDLPNGSIANSNHHPWCSLYEPNNP